MNKIEEAFKKAYPYAQGNLYEAFYETFERGYTAGLEDRENALEVATKALTFTVEHTLTTTGFYIPIIEVERGWGIKVDGYMVALTAEELQARKSSFEKHNTTDYGLYYSRTDEVRHVKLTPTAIAKIKESGDKTYWFDEFSEFCTENY